MAGAQTKKGLLAGAFQKPFWDSKIKSQNTTKAEIILGYFIGPWGMLLTNSIVNSYFNQYLTDVVGFTIAKGAWIATFMVLFPVVSKIIDAITNMVMSKLIDMTTCKQGKVRPWMIISIPFVFLSILMLFWMPFANVYAQAVWVIVGFNLYYSVAFTMWNMSKELGVALSTRNIRQRRTNAMSATLVMNMGTGLVSILFPTMLTAIVRSLAGGNNAHGYFYAMAIIACIMVPLTFIQYFYTRERVTEERREHPDAAENEGVQTEESFKTQFLACIKNKYWVIFMILIIIWQIITQMRNISLVYYSGWVVHGNSYGEYASVQAKFQIIAMQPMFFGFLFVLPLMQKWGRRRVIWVGSTLTLIGSVVAYIGAGSTLMVYAGSALAGFGNVTFSYLLPSFLGDCIDHVEWKTKVRCEGFSGAIYGAFYMFSVGIAQGLFNLGLALSGYMQPEKIGTNAAGIDLYADQTASATQWINMSYQGTYIIIGLIMFIVFLFIFKIDNDLPIMEKELQDRKIAEFEAKGMVYVSPAEKERLEIEEQDKIAEEIRIKELREKCEKTGKDFETENQKALEKIAKKKEKAAKKKQNQKI